MTGEQAKQVFDALLKLSAAVPGAYQIMTSPDEKDVTIWTKTNAEVYALAALTGAPVAPRRIGGASASSLEARANFGDLIVIVWGPPERRDSKTSDEKADAAIASAKEALAAIADYPDVAF